MFYKINSSIILVLPLKLIKFRFLLNLFKIDQNIICKKNLIKKSFY